MPADADVRGERDNRNKNRNFKKPEFKKQAPQQEAPKAEAKQENPDLNTLKVAELRELAKAKGIAGYADLKKAELIEALTK
nr:Rho termination factor N-terminal domain-containing protein [Acholeplasma equirhinis]